MLLKSAEEGSVCTLAKFAMLEQAVKAAADSFTEVVYVNAVAAAGGSSSSFSNAKYFQDAIHLNKKTSFGTGK